MLTFERLASRLENYGGIIRCKSFEERRLALNILLDMGFDFEETTKEYLEDSERNHETTFMFPGIDEGEIVCYSDFYHSDIEISFDEAIKIFREYTNMLDDSSEEEFEERIAKLLFY